ATAVKTFVTDPIRNGESPSVPVPAALKLSCSITESVQKTAYGAFDTCRPASSALRSALKVSIKFPESRRSEHAIQIRQNNQVEGLSGIVFMVFLIIRERGQNDSKVAYIIDICNLAWGTGSDFFSDQSAISLFTVC